MPATRLASVAYGKRLLRRKDEQISALIEAERREVIATASAAPCSGFPAADRPVAVPGRRTMREVSVSACFRERRFDEMRRRPRRNPLCNESCGKSSVLARPGATRNTATLAGSRDLHGQVQRHAAPPSSRPPLATDRCIAPK